MEFFPSKIIWKVARSVIEFSPSYDLLCVNIKNTSLIQDLIPHIMLRDEVTLKWMKEKMVFGFGYPRKCRFRKTKPNFLKRDFYLIKCGYNWQKLTKNCIFFAKLIFLNVIILKLSGMCSTT
jgi:hypothetical protein